jgi:hypothetical protein
VLKPEANWIKEVIFKIDLADVNPLLNVGSSSLYFRKTIQPWIEEEIFLPLQKTGYEIFHADIKKEEGVDIVGNFLDSEFVSKLKEYKFRSIICSNFLEHVEEKNREIVCTNLLSVIQSGGYLIVTVPYKYLWHPDPIDTMFRPNIDELAILFPKTNIIISEILKCEHYYSRFFQKPYKLIRLMVRLLLPFINPKGWLQQFKALKYFFTRFEVTCVLLQKQ